MHDEHDGVGAVSSEVNRIGRVVMDAAFAVHRELGPAFWRACMSNASGRTSSGQDCA